MEQKSTICISHNQKVNIMEEKTQLIIATQKDKIPSDK